MKLQRKHLWEVKEIPIDKYSIFELCNHDGERIVTSEGDFILRTVCAAHNNCVLDLLDEDD